MDKEELKIVRAVNFCLMNREKITELAIKENTTVGELYVKVAREDVNEFTKLFAEESQQSFWVSTATTDKTIKWDL